MNMNADLAALLDAVLDAPTAGHHQEAQRAAVGFFGSGSLAWTAYAAARDLRLQERAAEGKLIERATVDLDAVADSLGWPDPDDHGLFPASERGLLPVGTETSFGVIAGRSFTAYELVDGSFVAFDRVHAPAGPAVPLVVLR